ncbi:MAG: hypothetical protein L0312_01940, partial [Acidobacteria bacterium]|nr:hypothetical protein [Acidobacteriota bacterium]
MIDRWKDSVNSFIGEYWELPDNDGSYPPNELMPSGTSQRQAAVKAWQICKGAKAKKQPMPVFKRDEFDLTQGNIRLKNFTTSSFDFWAHLSTTKIRELIFIPCKRHRALNAALKKGELRKSAKISRRGRYYYLTVYVKIDEKPAKNTKAVGVDVGLTNTVATSDGLFFGEEVQAVRKKTKHRKYLNGASAQKQEINRVAKQLVETYPEHDFSVERLNFKGKGKRPKSFRRKYNT